ncbi:hypothetical protein CRD60_01030 [Bifidobacterium aemilianum]|uniref:PD-(D/E)XK endonuclease-like domain-containing protein n=1 Tax=Bifidobacterium aemilianum TaxID=2493120 RepID=A0A366K9Q8_9BIFI|nr:PD-(D/E)XK nuclease-like domain-containing protein [Bifidobacterium aemilianum]RBP98480.1 hypothetical protein CRD60_01030 [Bifidobacterium aemilianum]
MVAEIREMPDKDYFALDAVDQSALKRFMVSPLAYVDYLEHGLDVSSAALSFGTLAHGLVLGTGGEVALKPNLRTKAGKEEMAVLQAKGVTVVSQDDMDLARRMSKMTAPYFQAIPGRGEVAVLADDPVSGLALKGKYDWLPDGPDEDGVLRIRDYKTTADDPRDFPRVAARLGYHIQAAFYMMLYRLTGYEGPIGFEFVVQEKKRPYDFMVWRFSEGCEEVSMASEHIAQALDELAAFKRDSPDGWRQRMAGYGLDKTPKEVTFTSWQIEREYEEMEA